MISTKTMLKITAIGMAKAKFNELFIFLPQLMQHIGD